MYMYSGSIRELPLLVALAVAMPSQAQQLTGYTASALIHHGRMVGGLCCDRMKVVTTKVVSGPGSAKPANTVS